MHQHDKPRTSAHPLHHDHAPTITTSGIDHTQGELTTPKRLHLNRLHRHPLLWIGAACLIAWLAGFGQLAGGVVFAVALFFVNQLVDQKMTGGDE